MTNITARKPSVKLVHGKATTTSLKIADVFGKRHRDVLRTIANLECSPEFRERNFALSQYEAKTPTGGAKMLPMYTITRDGFAFLASGFTGKEAAQWKEKFIEAFNKLEQAALEKAANKRAPKALPPAQKALPPADPVTKNLRGRINRKAHEIAVKQYDTIHAILTATVEDNLACGATEEGCEGYIEKYGDLADGTVLMNIRDAQELVVHAGRVIDEAATAIAAIKRIEKRSGFNLYPRMGPSKFSNPDFHKHDRMIEEVIDRMVGNEK